MRSRLRITESGTVRRVRRARRRDDDEHLDHFSARVLKQLHARGGGGIQAAQRLAGAQRSAVANQLSTRFGNQALQRMLLQQARGLRSAAVGGPTEEPPAFEAPKSWGERQQINVNTVSIEVYGATTERLRVIQDTLSLLPTAHLDKLPQIVVGERISPIGSGRFTKGALSVKQGEKSDRLEVTHDALDNQLRQAGINGPKVSVGLLQHLGVWNEHRMTLVPPRSTQERQKMLDWYQQMDQQGATHAIGVRIIEAYWGAWMKMLPDEIRKVINQKPSQEDLGALE